MRNKQFVASYASFLFAGALVVSSACNMPSGSPTSPSSPPGNQPPPQDRYETLPATHYLVDASGKETEMWAKLHWVKPERGSKVQIGPSACPDNCFRYSIELGLDMIKGETNINLGSSFEMWFSLDGQDPMSDNRDLYRLDGAGVAMSQSQMRGSNIIRAFQIPPKFILVKGNYRRSWTCPCPPGGPPDPITGLTSFELDYQ